jgi:hypothetical protein
MLFMTLFKFIMKGVKRVVVAYAKLATFSRCFVENFECITNLTNLVKLKNWEIWATWFQKLKGAATLRQVQYLLFYRVFEHIADLT